MSEPQPAAYRWNFRTDRLDVEHWRRRFDDDREMADVVIDILSPAVTRFLPEPWRGDYTCARAQRWIAERDRESALLIVLDRVSGNPVGFLVVAEDGKPPRGRELRIGFVIAEAAWGRGFATELLAGFTHRCRAEGVSSLVGGAEARNSPSRRVLEKCGFREDSSSATGDHCLYRLVLG